jgi:hypothetical protein
MPNWNEVQKEIAKIQVTPGSPVSQFDIVRRKYLLELHKHTGRNVIAYYSGFLTKPKIEGVEITDEDKNGLMVCVHKMERSKGLDLFIHSPGGDIAATESLIHYLREMFGDDIRAFVPHIAMSAGTMLACACREIVMGKHSNIGPVDPQFNGIPAIGVIEEVKRAYQQITEDQRYALVWNPILSRLPPSFLQQCEWAIERSEEHLRQTLLDGMLKNVPDPEKTDRLNRAVSRLVSLSQNKAHNRHFHYQDCREMGLEIKLLEEMDKVLQDLTLTVHHCFMHTMANTAAFKIIEDQRGRAHVRLAPQAQPLLFQVPQPGGNLLAPSGPPH